MLSTVLSGTEVPVAAEVPCLTESSADGRTAARGIRPDRVGRPQNDWITSTSSSESGGGTFATVRRPSSTATCSINQSRILEWSK